MARQTRAKHFSFSAIEDPFLAEWSELAAYPVWKALVVSYASAGTSTRHATLIDELIAHLALPPQDYQEVGRSQGVALVRGYLLFDPVHNRPRSTPDDAEACALNFADLFSASAKFFADDEVASGGIKVARAAWRFSLIAIDESRIGGLWLADED